MVENTGEEEMAVLPEDRSRPFELVASQGEADKFQVGSLVQDEELRREGSAKSGFWVLVVTGVFGPDVKYLKNRTLNLHFSSYSTSFQSCLTYKVMSTRRKNDLSVCDSFTWFESMWTTGSSRL